MILEEVGVQVEAFPLNHGIDSFGFIFRETAPCVLHKEPYKPRSFAYCSDTAPLPELAEWVKGVDLLYHEGTYLNVDFRKAQARFHSTVHDAACCAASAGVGRLLLGHYSSSISSDDIKGDYIAQAREVFPNSFAVADGDIFDIPVL